MSICSLLVAAVVDAERTRRAVAGPDRPVPVAPPSRPPLRATATASGSGGSSAIGDAQNAVSAKAAEMSGGVGDLYNRLGTALQERG